MKKIALLLLSVLCAAGLYAQEADTNACPKWRFGFSGFVNPQFFVDTRQVVSGREEMMLFYPKPVERDADGNDINAVPSLNMLAITARLALAIEGPDVLGAKIKGYIEGDYTGASDASINLFRLRHAYIDMRWKHHELLLGQYWYPMTVHEIMPATQPLNMGAPFHPYVRYTQARYTMRYGHFEALAVAAFQLDNKSKGPNGSSPSYLKHSLVPEINLQLRYHSERLLAGVAYNLLVIRPRDYVTDTLGGKHKTDTRYASHSFSAFMRYDWTGWRLNAQTILSDNLYEGCTLGGYIESYDVATNSYSYKPFHFTTVWVDFGRTRGSWRPGLFVGGAYNTSGSAGAQATGVYGRGYDIDWLYRIQPRIGYVTKFGLSFWFEIEHTFAAYRNTLAEAATEDRHDACRVHNERFILGAVYGFSKSVGRQ